MKSVPFLLLLLLGVLTLLVGSADIDAASVLRALAGQTVDDVTRRIVFEIRLPLLATGMLCGAALAGAGLATQTVFSNPLAEPSILGVNAGASLGAAVAILLTGGAATLGENVLAGYAFTILAATAGAFVVIALLLALAQYFRSDAHLLIAGIMISFCASALVSILTFVASEGALQSFVVWSMGDIGSVGAARLPIFAACVVAALLGLLLSVKPLNALLLGAEYAHNLGFRVRHVRLVLLGLVGVLSGIVTAFCGPIAFVGIAAPHFARLVHRTSDHRRLMPLAFAWGADVVLLAQLLTHLPGGRTLPLGAVMPLIGVPVVLALLVRRQQRG